MSELLIVIYRKDCSAEEQNYSCLACISSGVLLSMMKQTEHLKSVLNHHLEEEEESDAFGVR